MNIQNAVGSNTVFFAYNASPAMQSIWSPSVAPTVGDLGERRVSCPSCGARRIVYRTYVGEADSSARFRWVNAPTIAELGFDFDKR